MPVAKIFVLEDDPTLNETLVDFLDDRGFSVESSLDGYNAEDMLYENRYDLLILDVNVPNLNGFELLNKVRETGVKTPAIFLTARDGIEDVKEGFSIGAEDYIKKPFVLEELFVRIEAILSRYNNSSKSMKISDTISFNKNIGEVLVEGKSFMLSNKETKLLNLFVNSKDDILTHEFIFNELWDYNETPSDSSLRTYIKNLRKIIGKERIVSIKKRGYRYIRK